MRSNDLIVLGLAALAAYAIVARANPNGRASVTTGGGASGYATLLQEWNGWRYFSDGTAISPEGAYYQRDDYWNPVWSPTATYRT